MSENEKHLEEMLKACQQVTQRQRKEIEALRKLLDDLNSAGNVEWRFEKNDGNWTSEKIIKREA